MAPIPNPSLDPGDQINVAFGVIEALLALLAVGFAAAAWHLQRRRNRDRQLRRHTRATPRYPDVNK